MSPRSMSAAVIAAILLGPAPLFAEESPLSGTEILFVVRPQYRPDHHATETMFQTGEINTGSFQGGSALKAIVLGRGGEARTIVEAPRGIIRDPEVSFDGTRIVFSMRRDGADDFHIHEVAADGSGLRQITSGIGVSDIDPAYLPDGDIVFSSTREPKYCHCNRHIMANLFRARPDGSGLRQIGRNTLFEGHAALLPDGRLLYDRWEYVDRHFGPSFGLWTANPDGTSHALYWHNNAWTPGAIGDARPIPGTHRVVATLGSCHDRPWGAIAAIDRALGLEGKSPVVRIWPESARALLTHDTSYGSGAEAGHPVAGQIDNLTRVRPRYEDPYPLHDGRLLASREVSDERMGLFLLDAAGADVLLHVEGPGCYDPMPLAPRERPPVLPPQSDLRRGEARFYVRDVHRGSGMETVPRGTIRWLRIIEAPAKLFWTQGYWAIDATQAPAMNWNCTSSKKILGDVPVEADGSVHFLAPADRFLFFQALDGDKMMVQSMRSGATAMPGETVACAGCHEGRLTAPPALGQALALRRPPSSLEPWYGPPRDFDFAAEVQPVLDRHCVRCHDHGKKAGEKLLLAGDLGLAFNASYVDLRRRSPMRWVAERPGAPKALVKAVDDGPPEVLPPHAWGSHRSRLVDVIRGGHRGVRLDRESFERIVTWIDMNAPYYGSYASAYPDNAFGRSPLDGRQLARLRELTGRPLGETGSELAGSQVSFTRPELSPVLRAFAEPADPRRREALAIIEAGRETLRRLGRPDIPGSPLPEVERRKQEKYDALTRAERESRRSLAGPSSPTPKEGN